jgi:hypothetical protein
MDIADEIRDRFAGEWLAEIYRSKVRTQRTRAFSIDVPAKENQVEILHTLLGIEIQIGKKRFPSPDLATARYMRVFARIGCSTFAVPYDITTISAIADELEISWQKMLLYLDAESTEKAVPARRRLRPQLIKRLRSELDEIGAGELMPEFKQSTKQRNN